MRSLSLLSSFRITKATLINLNQARCRKLWPAGCARRRRTDRPPPPTRHHERCPPRGQADPRRLGNLEGGCHGNTRGRPRPEAALGSTRRRPDLPFGFNYTFESEGYARSAGNLLLLRPRVFGSKARGILETKEPRQYPIEFEGLVRDTDSFEITLPPGYAVEDVPPSVDADFRFRQLALQNGSKSQRTRLHPHLRSERVERSRQPGRRPQEVLSNHRQR